MWISGCLGAGPSRLGHQPSLLGREPGASVAWRARAFRVAPAIASVPAAMPGAQRHALQRRPPGGIRERMATVGAPIHGERAWGSGKRSRPISRGCSKSGWRRYAPPIISWTNRTSRPCCLWCATRPCPGWKSGCCATARARSLASWAWDGNKVEALFIVPSHHGRGGGRRLLAHARALKGPLRLDVNEHNPAALGFYQALGFAGVGRSPLDGEGRPFPLLHMEQPADAGAPS